MDTHTNIINQYKQTIPFYSAKPNKPSAILLSRKEPESKPVNERFAKTAFYIGATSAALQVGAGLLLLGKSKVPKNLTSRIASRFPKEIKSGPKFLKKVPNELLKNIKKDPLKGIADSILALSYLISVPANMNAAVQAKQPGLVLTTLMWMVASPFMAMDLGTRVKGLLTFSYAPSYAGFANEIHNKHNLKPGEKPREMEINWKNPLGILKFGMEDLVCSFKEAGNAIKHTYSQSMDVINGKRKKRPDILSTKPSEESMHLGTALMMIGAVPKVILGNKLIKNINGVQKRTGFCKVIDAVIGLGFLFDSLGMMSLANSQKGFKKTAMLAGGPMRVVGDFGHENNFLYGLRTLGGASFEYYWATLNKKED